MKNLKELVSIDSSKDEEEIINYLQTRFEDEGCNVEIIKNVENNKKSILVGINTPLVDVCPHCSFRAH